MTCLCLGCLGSNPTGPSGYVPVERWVSVTHGCRANCQPSTSPLLKISPRLLQALPGQEQWPYTALRFIQTRLILLGRVPLAMWQSGGMAPSHFAFLAVSSCWQAAGTRCMPGKQRRPAVLPSMEPSGPSSQGRAMRYPHVQSLAGAAGQGALRGSAWASHPLQQLLLCHIPLPEPLP